ncbi:MAG: transglycosylase SLT domain-containing protein [Thiotrichales bacterium]|nr:transglycosylase SLT domain-containing protein [Thiotrichales bacterium]
MSLIANALLAGPVLAESPYDVYARQAANRLWQQAQQYEHGEGVVQDYDEAVRRYCVAARKGLGDAAYQLGWMYANGRGVSRNEPIAAAWFAAAAGMGDSHAQRMLQRLAVAPHEQQRKCLLADGTEYLEPLQSVPDPEPAVIRSWVERLAPDYQLQAALVLAVIETESNFNSKARSHKNAQGLMQLIPETAQRFGVQDSWDPLDNIRGGMAYLRWLLDHFNGDLSLALAGYNAGERAVQRYRGIPPYAETQAYVRRVLHRYRKSGV